MTAVILAAGYAKRLYPYTKNFPKSLLKINGKPLLDYTIEKLLILPPINKILIVVNARFYPYFKKWLNSFQTQQYTQHKNNPKANSPFNKVQIEIINDNTITNESRLGSIGDLQFVIEKKKLKEELLVICSDKVFNFDLNAFIKYFEQKQAVVNACQDEGDAQKLVNKHGCALLDASNKMLSYVEKPTQPLSSVKSMAFYIYPKTALPLINKYLKSNHNPDAPGYFSEWLHQKVPMYAWFINGECFDVGNPESYNEINKLFNESAQVADFFQKKITITLLRAALKDKIFKENKILLMVQQGPHKKMFRQLESLLDYLAQDKTMTLVYIMVKMHELGPFLQWLDSYPVPLPTELLTFNENDQPIDIQQINTAQKLGITSFIIIDGEKNKTPKSEKIFS